MPAFLVTVLEVNKSVFRVCLLYDRDAMASLTQYKNWCCWTVVLEKTVESPLDCKEIQPVHPKGNQSWIFFGRTDAEVKLQSLATWCKELTHWKRLWCWERLNAGGEEDNRIWDGWMVSMTRWTWVWVSFREAWHAAVPGVAKSQTRLSDWPELTDSVKNLPAMQETRVLSLGQEESLEKVMATHSSILAWRIPWTEEPGKVHWIAKELDLTEQPTHSDMPPCLPSHCALEETRWVFWLCWHQ